MGASALLLLFKTSETCGVFLTSVLCAQWCYFNNVTSGVSLKKESITNFRFFFNIRNALMEFEKLMKSVHHHTIQINQPTRCNDFSSLLLGVYLQLNMFRSSSRPLSGAQQLQYQPLILPLEPSGSSAVGRGGSGRPEHEQQHCYHPAPTVKPEAATAFVELLMMGGKTPETC
jgi:hypothetical protein